MHAIKFEYKTYNNMFNAVFATDVRGGYAVRVPANAVASAASAAAASASAASAASASAAASTTSLKYKLPWHIPADLQHFQAYTTQNKEAVQNVIIMGKNTYESLPRKLPDRIHIVVTHNPSAYTTEQKDPPDYVLQAIDTVILADKMCKEKKWHKPTVIGGALLLDWFLQRNLIGEFAHTLIPANTSADLTFQLDFSNIYWEIIKRSDLTNNGTFAGYCRVYRRINTEENMVLQAMQRILNRPNLVQNRTAVLTKRILMPTFRFDLRGGKMPLLTSRKQWLRGAFLELMFYLSGNTDTTILSRKGFKGWEKQTTREFLDARGLQRLPVGDMGAAYGFQLRHYGARYVDCHTDYTGQGFDQLTNLIHKLKHNPTDRRLMITMYNPADESSMAIPACLHSYQFFVENDELSCLATQRSSDVGVASGWNIAQIALLVRLLGVVTGYPPGEITWAVGDCHAYRIHFEALQRQITAGSNMFPLLHINRTVDDIHSIEWSDLQLLGYQWNSEETFDIVE